MNTTHLKCAGEGGGPAPVILKCAGEGGGPGYTSGFTALTRASERGAQVYLDDPPDTFTASVNGGYRIECLPRLGGTR